MRSATVTSKGQVTIPLEVRKRLGLRPGSRLSFVPTGSGGYEVHSSTGSVSRLKGSVTPPQEPVSIEEMNEAIAAEASSQTP